MRRRWQMTALPLELYEQLPPDEIAGGMESAYVSFRLRELGVPRKIAEKWPQQLGVRVVLRLAQRGRIAFAVLFGRRDLKRAARVSVRRLDEGAHRIEPVECLMWSRSDLQRSAA